MPINSERTKNISLKQGYERGLNRFRKPSKEIYIVVIIHLPSVNFDAKDGGGTLHRSAWPQISLDSGDEMKNWQRESSDNSKHNIPLRETLPTVWKFWT